MVIVIIIINKKRNKLQKKKEFIYFYKKTTDDTYSLNTIKYRIIKGRIGPILKVLLLTVNKSLIL